MIHLPLVMTLQMLIMSMLTLYTPAHSYTMLLTKLPFKVGNNFGKSIDGFSIVSSQDFDSSKLQMLNNQDQAFQQRTKLSSPPPFDEMKSSSAKRNGDVILRSSSSFEQQYKSPGENDEIIIPSLINYDGNSDKRLLFPGQADYLKTRNAFPSRKTQTTGSSRVSELDKISFPKEGSEVAIRAGRPNYSMTTSSNKATTTTRSPLRTQSNLQAVFFPDSLTKSEEDDEDELPSKLNAKMEEEEKKKQEHQQSGENETDLNLGLSFHSLLSAPDRGKKCRGANMQRVHGVCRPRYKG